MILSRLSLVLFGMRLLSPVTLSPVSPRCRGNYVSELPLEDSDRERTQDQFGVINDQIDSLGMDLELNVEKIELNKDQGYSL